MNDTFKELDGQELDQVSGGLRLPFPIPRPWPCPLPKLPEFPKFPTLPRPPIYLA